MKRRMLGGVAALAATFMLLPGTAAYGRATSRTVHFSGSDHHRDANPCTGAPGTFSETVSGVFHITKLADGSRIVIGSIRGEFTFTANDPSQPTYTGREGGEFTKRIADGIVTRSVVFRVRAVGTDGSVIIVRAMARLTIDSQGNVTVRFRRHTLICP
jgi:hypothetical protein